MSKEMEPRTYTIDEVAALLGLSRNLTYQLAKEDRLPVPTIRLGRRIVVAKIALDAILNGSPDGRAA